MTTSEIKNYQEQIFIGQKDLTKYEKIERIITEALDAEFSRLFITKDNNNIVSITEFFMKGDVLSIFNPAVLKDTVETICTNHALFKFIFNITQRCVAAIELSEINIDTVLSAIKTSAAVDRSMANMQYCLLPRPMQETININQADVDDILRNNFWTGIVYLSVLFLEKTQTYKTLVANFN